MGRKASVKENALEFLYQNKKIIFQNSDLSHISSSGSINDLLYNLRKKRIITKVKRGYYLFPELLKDVMHHNSDYLDFYMTHQFDDCYIGGLQSIMYFFQADDDFRVITSKTGSGIEFECFGKTFKFEPPILFDCCDDIVEMRIDGINFRISSPIRSLFEASSMEDIRNYSELITRYCKAQIHQIKKNFVQYVEKFCSNTELLLYILELFSQKELKQDYYFEIKILEKLVNSGKLTERKLILYSNNTNETFDDYDKFKPIYVENSSKFLFFGKDINVPDGRSDTIMVFAPAGYLRQEFLYRIFEKFDSSWKFWYTIDFSDRDILTFFRHFVLLFSERFPEIMSEYQKIVLLLPEDEEMASELIFKFVKNIFKKYFLHNKILIVFDMFDKIRNSVSGKLILNMMSSEWISISGIVGSDSKFYTGQNLLLNEKISVYDIGTILLSGEEISNYFTKRGKIRLKDNDISLIKNLTWGIPVFIEYIFNEFVAAGSDKRKLSEMILTNHDIFDFSIEEVFLNMNSEIKRFLLMYLATLENANYPILNEFLNWISLETDVNDFLSGCYGYIRITHGEIELNPMIAQSIRKYVTNSFGIKYLKLLVKMSEFFELKRDYSNLCKVTGELVFLNKFDRTIEILKKFLEEFQKIGKSEIILKWITRMMEKNIPLQDKQSHHLIILKAQIFSFLRKYNNAIECLKKIHIKDITEIHLKRDYNYFMGISMLGLKKFETAAQCFNRALLQDQENDGSNINLGDDYQRIAWVFDRKEDWGQAAKYYLKAYRYYIRGRHPLRQSQVISNMAINYFMNGKMDNVVKMYNRAIHIANSQNDQYSESQLYYNLAIIYFFVGELYKAIKFLNVSLKKEQKLGNRYELAFTYLTFGYVYNALDKERIAEKYLELAGDIIFSEGPNYHELVFTYNLYMSDCKFSSGNLQEGKKFRQKALKFEKIIKGDNLYNYYIMNNQARLSFFSGKYRKSLNEYECIINELSSISDYYQLKTKFYIVCVLLYLGKETDAFELFSDIMPVVIQKRFHFWEVKELFPVYLQGLNTRLSDDIQKYCELILTDLSVELIEEFQEVHKELFTRSKKISNTLNELNNMEYKGRYLVKTTFETYVFNEKDLRVFDENREEYDLWLDFVNDSFYSRSLGDIEFVCGTKLYNLMKYFIRNSGVFFSLSEIYEHVWKRSMMNKSDLGTVRVSISRLRKAIEPDTERYVYLESKKTGEGMKYRFNSSSSYCALMNM